ncbi:MAG TPA: hypothetical protein VIZ65_07730 [Cellvibrionaceae bacterium]
MLRRVENYRKAWSDQDIALLQSLADADLSVQLMSIKLGRTEASISAKARLMNIKLRPVFDRSLRRSVSTRFFN